jgi:hypothetical protein
VRVLGRNLGLFGGLNYARNFRLIDEASVARVSGLGVETRGGAETRGNITTDTGANVNIGYGLSENAELGFNFMFAESIDEEARNTRWTRFESNPPGYVQEQWQLHHTARQVQNFQLRGRHDFPGLADSKFTWNAGLANTTQDEPDHRFMNYTVDEDGRVSLGVQDILPFFPYFRKIEDQSMNVRADWTAPLPFFKEESHFKAGLLNSATDRGFREQYFTYDGVEGFVGGQPNSYLDDPRYLEYIAASLGGRRTNYNFARYVRSANGNPYQASQTVTAGYPMLDLGVLSWLRLVGGVRVEATSMRIDTGAGSSVLDQTDFLPRRFHGGQQPQRSPELHRNGRPPEFSRKGARLQLPAGPRPFWGWQPPIGHVLHHQLRRAHRVVSRRGRHRQRRRFLQRPREADRTVPHGP